MQIDVNGTTLRARVVGDGQPLLLIHGFPLTGEMWEPVLPALAARYRVIVPDLRGFGRSGVADAEGMETYADDLVALLDATGETRPVVAVGLSMGGYIAFELLRRHAARIRALVLTNTRTAPDTEDQRRTRHETAGRVLSEGSGVVADSMIDKLFAPGADEQLRATWHAIMASARPVGVAAALRAMARRPDSTETLRAFRGPVLVVAGAEDAVVPVAEAEAMREVAPDARFEIVDGSGHLTPLERPGRFAELLLRFLDELPGADGPDRAWRS